jgi:hypothetical protein
MGLRPRLMLSTAALAAAVAFALPPCAEAATDHAASYGRRQIAPLSVAAPARRAEEQSTPPQEQRPPAPAPTGCPFRNGKLDLIT